MRRREFITIVGGAAAAWPLVARAQPGERVRLVWILEGVSQDTPNADARYTAFAEGLQQLGWTPGHNLKIEMRWGGGDEAATPQGVFYLQRFLKRPVRASFCMGKSDRRQKGRLCSGL
jgi:hypothetical protein